MLRVVNIVGTRPNLVKMAAVFAAQRARPDVFAPLLVHTGQHRDPAMSERFFAELELPPPDVLDASGLGAAFTSFHEQRHTTALALDRLVHRAVTSAKLAAERYGKLGIM